MRRFHFVLVILVAFVCLGLAQSVSEPDPKALSYKLPKDLKWSGTSTSAQQEVVLVGDPSKEGLYVVLHKWNPHNMSRPHSHPNDRYITVISGTWWVGTGSNYDPDTTMPIPAGSFVTHYGKQIHYDGAKDGEVILQIVGMGPANSGRGQ